jgi:beta-glucosidase
MKRTISYTTFKYSQLYIAKLADPKAYKPSTGLTSTGSSSNPSFKPSDYLPPADFTSWKIPGFIYPYITSTSQIKKGTYPAPAGAYSTKPQPIPAAGGAPGGNPSLYEAAYEVSAMITNTGAYAGEEVVQLYLETGLKDDPVVVLRNFEKVSLAVGQSTMVRMMLNRKDLARWDVVKQDWVVTEGVKKVRVGSSSRNTPLTGTLT